MKVEFYSIAFRKKICRSLEELQQDVDAWLLFYNNERPQGGRFCYGKTPIQTFSDCLHIAEEKLLHNQHSFAIGQLSDNFAVS